MGKISEQHVCPIFNMQCAVLQYRITNTFCSTLHKRERRLTKFLFFTSLNANLAKSFTGTSFLFGRSFAAPMRTCLRKHDGTISSAIWRKIFRLRNEVCEKQEIYKSEGSSRWYFAHWCNKNSSIPRIRLFKVHLQSYSSSHRFPKQEAWQTTEIWIFCTQSVILMSSDP